MIKVENFPNAYKEVYEILSHMNEQEVKMIPKNFFDMLKKNMNMDYKFSFNEEIDFEKQSVLKETKVILGYIFLNYWGTDEQKNIIKEKFRKDILNEEKLKPEYKQEELFKKRSINNISTEEVSLIEYKPQNIFIKILNRIKKILKRNKD